MKIRWRGQMYPGGISDGSRRSFRGTGGERPPEANENEMHPGGMPDIGSTFIAVLAHDSGIPSGCVPPQLRDPVVVRKKGKANDHRLPSANPIWLRSPPGGCVSVLAAIRFSQFGGSRAENPGRPEVSSRSALCASLGMS